MTEKLPKYIREEKPTFFEEKKGPKEKEREETEKTTEKMIDEWNAEVPEKPAEGEKEEKN